MILNIIDKSTFNKITELLFKKFNFDFSIFEDLIFRIRLSYSLYFLQIKPTDIIENICTLDKEQFEIILHFIYPDETELFRDTGGWIYLKTKILNKINSNKCTKVLIYNSTAGENLFSLLILLNELNLLENFQITITSPSNYSINNIINGVITQPKNRSSILNFKEVIGNDNISKYFEKQNNKLILNNKLLNKVKVLNVKTFENSLEKFDLVLFKNKTLYLKQEQAQYLFLKINNYVNLQGYLIIGTNENLPSNISSFYKPLSINEKIYQKNEQ